MGIKQIALSVALLGLVLPVSVFAHQPVLEPEKSADMQQTNIYFQAVKMMDPTKASQAVYGSIIEPGEVDVFAFVPENDAEIPLEILVPIRPSNRDFKPELIIMAKELEGGVPVESLALGMGTPDGYQAIVIKNEHDDGTFFEPFSFERYWKAERANVKVSAKRNYFLAVREPNFQKGDYTLGAGTVEDFSDANTFELLGNIASLKLGMVGNTQIPWLEIIGLFLYVAGFIVGLGAVTVIDTLGFLGRKSGYWTESTIRAHKVTKPLIWLGLGLLLVGAGITYRESWFTGVALFQALTVVLLILNGLFLTFYVSPKLLEREKDGKIVEILPQSLQDKITISFAISFIGWWMTVFLFVWYLVMMR